MPTDLGTIAAGGVGGAQDALRQMIADRLKQALLAQQKQQQAVENEQKNRSLDIQAKSEAAAEARNALMDKERLGTAEAGTLGAAIDNTPGGADLTRLVTPLLGSGTPQTQTLIRGLAQKQSANIWPSSSAAMPASTGETGPVTPAKTGPVGVSTKYYNPKPAPVQKLEPADFTRPGAPKYESGGYDPEGNVFKDQGGNVVKDAVRYHPPTAADFTADPAQIEEYAQMVVKHRIAPSQISSLLGGFGTQGQVVKRAVLSRVNELDPNFNFQEAESGYSFGKNPGTQRTVRNIDNIVNTIPIMTRLVDKAKLAGVPVINTLTLGARKNVFADTDVANYNFMQTALADEFGQILGGGGSGNTTSDKKIQLALDAMSKDMSPDMWRGVLETAKEVFGTRRAALTKGTYLERPSEAPKPAQYKAGDSVLYQGKTRTVQSVNPDGTLVLAPIKAGGG